MAEIKEGILGGVNGTVGTVVGFSWRGRDFLRARPKRSNKPASVLQRLQRDKMSLISTFTSQVKDFVNAHYPRVLLNNKMATGKEQLNSRLLKKGIVILDGEPCIDLEQVLLSVGILLPAAVKKISRLKSGRIKMQWDNSISNALTASSDRLTVMVYHEETNAFAPIEHIALRGDKYAHFTLPNAWEQGTVHFWSVWKSADGEYISTSAYHGKVCLMPLKEEPTPDEPVVEVCEEGISGTPEGVNTAVALAETNPIVAEDSTVKSVGCDEEKIEGKEECRVTEKSESDKGEVRLGFTLVKNSTPGETFRKRSVDRVIYPAKTIVNPAEEKGYLRRLSRRA